MLHKPAAGPAAAALVCFLHAATARADDRPPITEPASVEVQVIGSPSDGLPRVPGSGTRVTEAEMTRRVPLDTGEVLRTVPGVQVRQDYGGGNRMDVSIRGLESGRGRKVLMLEDGIPIALNPYAESDLNFGPPVERMRGIEVVKGSGNILFGPQTLGGVINFITLAPPDHTHLVADVEVGARGYTRQLLQYGDAYGNLRYVGQVFHKHGDGFRDISFDVTDVFQKIAYDTSATGETVLKLGFHNETNDSDAVGLTRAMYAATPERARIAIYDRQRGNNYQISVTHEERFTLNTKLKVLAYAYRTDRIWRRQDYDRAAAPSTAYDRIEGDPLFPNGAVFFRNTNSILDREYDVVGLEPRLEHKIKTGSVSHTFDVGARILGETAHYQQRSGTIPTSFSGSLDYEERHRTFAIAGYLQDRIAFRDSLLVTPGIRLERAAFNRVILRQGTSAGVTDVSAEGDSLSVGVIPGLGMVYGSRETHVFSGMHVGWAPPRITSSVVPRGTPTQLDPERSINYELGMRTKPAAWVRFEGAGFLSNFTNQVVSNTNATGSGGEQVNGGPTRILGAESSAVVGFGTLFKIPLTIDLGARYTFARATFVGGANDGTFLPYAPIHSFNTNLDIEHATGVGGQLSYTFASEQFADVANTRFEDATGRTGRLPSRHVVDATVHYNHKPSGLSLRLTMKNATNDIYIVSRRPEGIFPAGYRQVIAALRFTYDRPPPRP